MYFPPHCFVSAYDDDGETTRFRSHGEHWRARVGFRSCSANKTTKIPANKGANISANKTTNISANKGANLSANKAENTDANVNLHLTLSFQVSPDSSYDTKRNRVMWTVHGVTRASRVSCDMSKGMMPQKGHDATEWVHSRESAVLQIFASIHGHECVIFG